MLKNVFLRLVAGSLAAAVLLAQAKAPTPKSQKEVDALNAMIQAADNDTRIKAANELLTKFADTDFKGLALYMIIAWRVLFTLMLERACPDINCEVISSSVRSGKPPIS